MDEVDVDILFDKDEMDSFVEVYNEVIRGNEIACCNFYSQINVILKSSDRFNLKYSLDWTVGEAETGCADTPYSDF